MRNHTFTGLRLRRSGITVVRVCLLTVLTGSNLVLSQETNSLETKSREVPPQQSINLNHALQQTLQQNAELKAYPYYLRVSEAELLQAEQRPLPTLGFSAENVLGNSDYSGTDQAEFTLTLGQTIELGGKRESRVALAATSRQSRQAEYELARLDVLAETSRRYYELLRLQLLNDWIDKRADSERNALDVIQRRAKAGVAKQADVSKMQLKLSRSKALAFQLNGQTSFARTKLAAMWSASPAFTAVNGNLLSLPVTPNAEQITEALTRSPAFMRQQVLQRLADAQVQLALANSKVNLDVGVGLRRFEATNDQALVFNVSMPIALSNPNRGRLAAAQAEHALSIEQGELVRIQLRLSLMSIQQTLTNHSQYAQLITSELLPLARQLLTDTEAGYSKGRYSVLQWTDAQAELFSLERELIETHTLVYLQILELERITGQPMLPSQWLGNPQTSIQPFTEEPTTFPQQEGSFS